MHTNLSGLKREDLILFTLLYTGFCTTKQIMYCFGYKSTRIPHSLITNLIRSKFVSCDKSKRSLDTGHVYNLTEEGRGHILALLRFNRIAIDDFNLIENTKKKKLQHVQHDICVNNWFYRLLKHYDISRFSWLLYKDCILTSYNKSDVYGIADAGFIINGTTYMIEQDMCQEHRMQVVKKFKGYYDYYLDNNFINPILVPISISNLSKRIQGHPQLSLLRKELRSLMKSYRYKVNNDKFTVLALDDLIERKEYILNKVITLLSYKDVNTHNRLLALCDQLEDAISSFSNNSNGHINSYQKELASLNSKIKEKEKEIKRISDIEATKYAKEKIESRISLFQKFLIPNDGEDPGFYNMMLRGLDIYIAADEAIEEFVTVRLQDRRDFTEKLELYLLDNLTDECRGPGYSIKTMFKEPVFVNGQYAYFSRIINITDPNGMITSYCIDDTSYGNYGGYLRVCYLFEKARYITGYNIHLFIIVDDEVMALRLFRLSKDCDVSLYFLEKQHLLRDTSDTTTREPFYFDNMYTFNEAGVRIPCFRSDT